MQTTKNSQKLQESLKRPTELMGKFGNFLGPEVNKRRIQRSDQTEKPVFLPDTGWSHGLTAVWTIHPARLEQRKKGADWRHPRCGIPKSENRKESSQENKLTGWRVRRN